jgi:hypothetical protein
MAEFFLNDAKFLQLCAAYAAAGNPTGSERKGIVILHSGGTCRIVGVKGSLGGGGRIIEIPGSARNPCPYPPPCLRDENGDCLTDEKGNFLIDDKDPDAVDFL